ncbi:MAG: replication factor C large subunit [Candidatus Pacearchaeota archaeon]|nr:replication factor C large subunit [Candidatus Pacearchaeota archaeon]
MSSLNFAEKYRPKSYKEIIGQTEAIKEIEKFIREYPKKKALILHGHAGVGKTTLVHTLAKEHDLDIFELNSSDLRNRLKLDEVLKPASEQQSLFKRGKILLMDEVDGVTGTDRGGVQELIRILQKSSHPIIMTGNDIWDSKFSQLRPKCRLVELKPLKTEDIVELLKKVLEIEKIEENPHFLKQIALKSQGDVRAALNDLQAYTVGKDNVDFLSERNKSDTIFNILKKLFQERSDFQNLFDETKMSLDEILLWIEENIPKEYKGKELARAYLALANADRFRGRIYRQQFWRFLVYQNIFQSAGISYAKEKPKTGFTKYERPSRILKIWLNNQKTAKKKTIAQKYAKHVHCSTKRAMRDFPIIKQILQSSPKTQTALKLTGEEIDFLRK